jgi:energy-coupling factor transporter ATP-binding protein EcfA2
VYFENKGLLINGPSGSGKSTLALLCLLNGYPMLADDVVLVEERSIFSVYKYAKVDTAKNPLDISQIQTFKMEDSPDSKAIINLENFGAKFMKESPLSAVILPIFAHLNHFEKLSPKVALELMAPNSMREIMGGTANSFKRIARIINSVPVFRLALSTDNQKNFATLRELVGTL